MHPNSLTAEPKPAQKSKMYHAIYAVYDIYARPLTDREVLVYLYGINEKDMNKVRPRITEMIKPKYKMEFLRECGKAKDSLTHETVRLVRIKRAEENNQEELF